MLESFNIVQRNDTTITFTSSEIEDADYVVFVVYDTSTGVSLLDDYYCWKTTTYESSTGDIYFDIDNTKLYQSDATNISNYGVFNRRSFYVLTYIEYQMLMDLLIRLDLVRRRLPNPGFGVSSVNDIGQNGMVTFSGGFDKKMTVGEIMYMMAGAIVEINASPPRTFFWPMFYDSESDSVYNPYYKNMGVPYDMRDLVVLGTLIRCLVALGILEVDINFSTTDSGLQITFDRVGSIKGWHDQLLAEYKEMKSLFKWNHANHAGIGVGTAPWAVFGIWGTLMNNVQAGGALALSSLLGFNQRGNVPL